MKPNHKIKLTEQQKVEWFQTRIKEALSVRNIETEQQFVDLVRKLRTSFKDLYERDVPGSFIRILLKGHGVDRGYSDGILKKKQFIFNLMDTNMWARKNKTHLRKMVEDEFKETILSMVFDEIYDEYFLQDELPKPTMNKDFYGQQALFD